MKKTGFLLTLSACFVGVFGALQVDKYMDSKHDVKDSIFSTSNLESSKFRPVLAEPLTAPAFDFKAAAKAVMPSVVSVDRFEKGRANMFDRAVVERETGTGSGVLVSDDGVIVTNYHVVEGNGTRVRVRLFDGRKLDAKVLGTDARSDIAVLKIEGKNLRPIELGTSGTLEVGEWVMAVGNPLGFDNTVSVGVVSSLKRNLPVGDMGLVEGIQTDAAINPGNSGGALCNAQGQLIGINSAIASSTGQSVGIGFAIPVDRVKKVVSDIVKYGAPRYAGLGIEYAGQIAGYMDDYRVRQMVSERIGREDFPNYGLFVMKTSGPAAGAGIKGNDFLLEVDGNKIETTFDLNKIILTKKEGDKVKVKFWQAGTIKEATVTLVETKPTI